VRRLTRTRYHECSVCGTRERFPRRQPDTAHPGIDVAFWVVLAILGAAFVLLLRWVG
jgi:hypothetical protein